MPALDRLCFQAFLDDFAQSFPESLNLLLLDGAPAHTAGRLVVPENVLLVRLPPYSPELDPVERLWQDLRARIGRDLPLGLDALQHRAATVIRGLHPGGARLALRLPLPPPRPCTMINRKWY